MTTSYAPIGEYRQRFFLISPPTACVVMLKFKLTNTSSGSAIYTTLPYVHATSSLTVSFTSSWTTQAHSVLTMDEISL